MVSRAAARSSLGCLFMLLIAAAVGYFGVNVGESYWRFYQYQDDDAARGEIRRTEHQRSDPDTLARRRPTRSVSPRKRGMISIRRTADSISIEADYDEHVEMPDVRARRFTSGRAP